MKITTFFIDRFTEVSFTSPQGVQEDGGVYGEESSYSTWNLSRDEDGTPDFVGVVKTNILYGELFKITLDTGNDFNTQFVPRINDFNNMPLQEYWDKIVNGEYTFNGISYSEYRPPSQGLTANRGRGNNPGGPTTGGGTPTDNVTLLDYAMGVKERVGWVEVNRSRASIYYELCSGGKRSRSDHFYDASKFIITPELFDPLNDNFVLNPNTLRPDPTFSYEKINPYSPEERFFTLSTSGTSPKRIGLSPVDNWFEWNNNSQGHIKVYKGHQMTEPNTVVGGFIPFAWPKAPILNDPLMYLNMVVSGNQIVLNGNPYGAPTQIKLPIPSGIGTFVNAVPLLTANSSDLISPMDRRLSRQSQFGTTEPISPVYSIDIWGNIDPISIENRTIQFGFVSNISTPSFGECKPVKGFEDKKNKNISLRDPFGLELYELDKSYKDFYSTFKFCPPRKKTEYELPDTLKKIPGVVEYLEKINWNPSKKTEIAKIKSQDIEELNLGNSTRIVKIGPFNPDANLEYNPNLFSVFKQPEINTDSFPKKISSGEINFFESDLTIDYYQEESIYNVRRLADLYYTNPDPPFDDAVNDVFIDISSSKSNRTFYQTSNNSSEKVEFRNLLFSLFNNEMEIENGIRSPNDFLVTNTSVPYGTYSYTLEKNIQPDGSRQEIIQLKQNGATSETKEFEKAVSSVLKTVGADKNPVKIVGVNYDGFPIYRKNNFEESLLDLTEQLTGVKEIIFRGSEVLNGVVSTPRFIQDPLDISQYLEVPEKVQYVNTGIYVTGSVDLNVGEQVPVSYVYTYSANSYLNLDTTSEQINSLKETNFKSGSISFLGNHKKENLLSQLSDNEVILGNGRAGIYFRSVVVKKGSFDESFYTTVLGWAPMPRLREFVWNIPDVDITHILISKNDAFGDERKSWARTVNDSKDIEIKSTKTGTLFLNGTAAINNTPAMFRFQINGNVIETNEYYKIPVLYGGRVDNGDTGTLGGSNSYQITYSPLITKTPPSKQRTVMSTQNTYGGWAFSGLWHRDGLWPKEHTFRSGLLGSLTWTPCDGGVNTGAWIKVPDERVRLEYHDFITYSRDTVYSYFHDLWLSIKNKIFLEEEGISQKVTDNIRLSPYTKDNITWYRSFAPNGNFETLEPWERNIVTERNILLDNIRKIPGKVLILRLRSNDPDPSRGLDAIKIPKYKLENNEGLIYYKPNHFVEEWITALQFGDDKLMDSKLNYTFRWYPEPTEHTRGFFKPDEWYKAIFLRIVTSPQNPNGQIAGQTFNGSCRDIHQGNGVIGKYITHPTNVKTFCDALYTAEEVLRMHRARLVEMKKYIDAKTNSAENSTSDFAKKTFSRSMKFVDSLKEFMRLVK
jgi:hypothetical protein